MTDLTISQIRNLSGPITDHLFYTTDEGQRGLWQYEPGSTSTSYPDNTGTILNTADGKVIKRVYTGPVNVKWFGARGKGSTSINNAPAIQLAIDTLADTGGIVFIPAGKYRFTDTIQLRNGVSLVGEESQHITILKYEGTGVAVQCYEFIDDAEVGCVETLSNIIII